MLRYAGEDSFFGMRSMGFWLICVQFGAGQGEGGQSLDREAWCQKSLTTGKPKEVATIYA